MKFFIKDFFSKCEQIRRKLRIWSHLLKKSLMESFIFCAVNHISSNFKFWVEFKYQIRDSIELLERGCQKPWMTINLYKINLSRQQSFFLPSKQDQRAKINTHGLWRYHLHIAEKGQLLFSKNKGNSDLETFRCMVDDQKQMNIWSV